MSVIRSGNISLLELIDLAFEQKHGNAAVAPLELDRVLDISPKWDAVHKAVRKAFEAHDLMLYVESLDGTEKRLTAKLSDEGLVWRTLVTGNLEHEHDPAVFQRTVYVRDDDASTFLKEFTGKEIEQPDTTTGGADLGKQENSKRRKTRRPDPQIDAGIKSRIVAVLSAADRRWTTPEKFPPTAYGAAKLLVFELPGHRLHEYSEVTVRKILAGTYPPMLEHELTGRY